MLCKVYLSHKLNFERNYTLSLGLIYLFFVRFFLCYGVKIYITKKSFASVDEILNVFKIYRGRLVYHRLMKNYYIII